MPVETILWQGGLEGHVVIIDQTLLPRKRENMCITTPQEMWQAIHRLQIRGAPAIGIAAAYGLFLGIRSAKNIKELSDALVSVSQYLASSRPTAVNLCWALERMQKKARSIDCKDVFYIQTKLWEEANAILEEDRQVCRALGMNGQVLVPQKANLLTHCNAGGLATSGYGTALAVFFCAVENGKKIHVYADETRPLWQGARLTTWELKTAGIPVTLICDNTAGFLMQQGKVDMIFVGADRIAANGDTANKVGTYSLAVLAHVHKVPFYIVAPFSTFDLKIENGSQIPIEERSKQEVIAPCGQPIAPEDIAVYSPAFDVTPARYITGIVTERGVIPSPLSKEGIRKVLGVL